MPKQFNRINRFFIILSVFVFVGIFSTIVFIQKRSSSTQKADLSIESDEWIIEWHKSQDKPAVSEGVSTPSMNIPFLDMTVTNKRPLLSVNNASGGAGELTYIYQIDRVSTFDSEALIEYEGIQQKDKYITEKQVEPDDALEDNTRYYFRARAVDSKGNKGPWAITRFSLDTSYAETFMNLTRIPVVRVEASNGTNPYNLIAWDYSSDDSFWAAAPPADKPWVKFDLGREAAVSRIWQLCDKNGLNGWLKHFVWQWSNDGKSWADILGTEVKNNDTYINEIDFKPLSARYLRILIKKWYGYVPRIFSVMFYSPGMPAMPEVPDGDYVLVVGNSSDGSTWTKLASFIENCGLGLETLEVAGYEVSLSMLNSLDKKPAAIVLSGILGDRSLSMFEYGGEFEIIRKTKIPILGICFGHQFLAMSHGMTFVRGMGFLDDTSTKIMEGEEGTLINIPDEYKNLEIFDGVPDPFVAAQIHIWSISDVTLPDEYEVIAESDYIQMVKSKERMVYGVQFHPEISYDYNQGSKILVNFLKMALDKHKERVVSEK